MNQFDPLEIQKKSKEILNLDISKECANKLSQYVCLLLKWNASYNLTSIESPSEVMTLHLMDSLSLVKNLDIIPQKIQCVLDVGSGGGLPAIPLSIVRPDINVSMVDAVQKKVIFLRQCIAMCRLKNAHAFHARIEQIKEGSYDVITSRAFASLPDMVDWTKHLLKLDGHWLAMKGRFPKDEIAALPEGIELVQAKSVDIAQGKIKRHLLVLKQKNNDF